MRHIINSNHLHPLTRMLSTCAHAHTLTQSLLCLYSQPLTQEEHQHKNNQFSVKRTTPFFHTTLTAILWLDLFLY